MELCLDWRVMQDQEKELYKKIADVIIFYVDVSNPIKIKRTYEEDLLTGRTGSGTQFIANVNTSLY